MQTSRSELRAFNTSGYEIFDDDFAAAGEVVIWSRVPQAPQLGDLYNFEIGGEVHELAVWMIRTFPGGWIATCGLNLSA